MDLGRVFKHLLVPPWLVTRAFPKHVLDAIGAAITASERTHDGELRFVVEEGLDPWAVLKGQTPRERAIELFSMLRVWDTANNSGVLIYVQLVDHRIEIIADRGIEAKVRHEEWEEICRRMEQAFKRGEFEGGALLAIESITALLARHFPPMAANRDELPDAPIVV